MSSTFISLYFVGTKYLEMSTFIQSGWRVNFGWGFIPIPSWNAIICDFLAVKKTPCWMISSGDSNNKEYAWLWRMIRTMVIALLSGNSLLCYFLDFVGNWLCNSRRRGSGLDEKLNPLAFWICLCITIWFWSQLPTCFDSSSIITIPQLVRANIWNCPWNFNIVSRVIVPISIIHQSIFSSSKKKTLITRSW